MDTSETYIKMCEKAEEIQKKWKVNCSEHGDDVFVYMDNSGEGYVIASVYEFCSPIGEFEGRTYVSHAWLPRQDQLQLLYRGIYNEQNAPLMYDLAVLRSFIWDENDKTVPYFRKFTSMEQLWLAFVMKEKYDKVWNGEEWLDER